MPPPSAWIFAGGTVALAIAGRVDCLTLSCALIFVVGLARFVKQRTGDIRAHRANAPKLVLNCVIYLSLLNSNQRSRYTDTTSKQ